MTVASLVEAAPDDLSVQVRQGHVDAQQVAQLLNAAANQHRHAQVTGDFGEWSRRSGFQQARSRDDGNRRKSPQRCGQSVGNADTDVALRLVATQILERQHRNDGPFGGDWSYHAPGNPRALEQRERRDAYESGRGKHPWRVPE